MVGQRSGSPRASEPRLPVWLPAGIRPTELADEGLAALLAQCRWGAD